MATGFATANHPKTSKIANKQYRNNTTMASYSTMNTLPVTDVSETPLLSRDIKVNAKTLLNTLLSRADRGQEATPLLRPLITRSAQRAALDGLFRWRRRWRGRPLPRGQRPPDTGLSRKRSRRAPNQTTPRKVTRKKPQSFAAALYIFAATPSSQSTCVCVTGHKSECWSACNW